MIAASNANPVPSASTVGFDRTLARRPVVLCIGGTDPSGGAGLPADARAAAAFGAHCCGVVTAVVAQNTRGAARCDAVSPEMLRMQLENLLEDIAPDAVKTGLLPSARHVEIVAQICGQLNVPLIVDTVFAPTSGVRFCDEDTVEAVKKLLLPRADLVTPNCDEAEILCGFAIQNEEDVARAIHFIRDRWGASAVLLKGGHGNGEESVDFLLTEKETLLRAPRLALEVRGTGCQLATAIAAQRACGVAVEESAQRAKAWLWQELRDAMQIGGGRRVTRGAA